MKSLTFQKTQMELFYENLNADHHTTMKKHKKNPTNQNVSEPMHGYRVGGLLGVIDPPFE